MDLETGGAITGLMVLREAGAAAFRAWRSRRRDDADDRQAEVTVELAEVSVAARSAEIAVSAAELAFRTAEAKEAAAVRLEQDARRFEAQAEAARRDASEARTIASKAAEAENHYRAAEGECQKLVAQLRAQLAAVLRLLREGRPLPDSLAGLEVDTADLAELAPPASLRSA